MNIKKNNLNVINLGFFGDDYVGKTEIINRILGLEFNGEMLATIGLSKDETKFTLKNGKFIKLVLGIQLDKKDFIHLH